MPWRLSVDVNDLQDDEMAGEMQRLGAKTSNWVNKRRMVATKRGLVQDKSHVDLDGKISFSSRQLQDGFQDVKAQGNRQSKIPTRWLPQAKDLPAATLLATTDGVDCLCYKT